MAKETENTDNEKCSKCDKVAGVLFICPVSSNVYDNYFCLIAFSPRQVCELTVYCSEVCQQRDTRLHALKCKKNRQEHKAEQEKEDNEKGRSRKERENRRKARDQKSEQFI